METKTLTFEESIDKAIALLNYVKNHPDDQPSVHVHVGFIDPEDKELQRTNGVVYGEAGVKLAMMSSYFKDNPDEWRLLTKMMDYISKE